MSEQKTFRDLLLAWQAAESVGTDDVLAAVLPLMEQVAQAHNNNQVAPLNGVDKLQVSLGELWFAHEEIMSPQLQRAKIKSYEKAEASTIEVTEHLRATLEDNQTTLENEALGGREEAARQAYFPDYVSWELKIGHHDGLSDVFVLGLILGSLATRLDFTETEALALFLDRRRDLASFYPRLHPFVAHMIERMTQLERRKRPADVAMLVQALKNYQYQEIQSDDEFQTQDNDIPVRTQIHEKLREKLFQINRRNQLIYFKETASSVNLTVNSMPYMLDHKNIRANQLFYINKKICKTLSNDKSHTLSNWLKLTDYPFTIATLDKVRLQAQRDAKEYGFSQLRLVAVFLRWSNLKESSPEKINSPFILIPVTLIKKKGVKDQFQIAARSEDAEINPALRHFLRNLYNINLPETVDASDINNIKQLYENLVEQLAQSTKEINLAYIDSPRIQLIHKIAKRKLADFNKRQRKSGTGLQDFKGMSYSYNKKHYDPLGIKIFERDIRVAAAPESIDNTVKTRSTETMVAQPVEQQTVEQQFYSIDQGEQAGVYQWEFDLCSVTLANFNYRKMTLVRDYSEIIDSDTGQHCNFDQLFSADVRPTLQTITFSQRQNNQLVLPADPSQQDAIIHAREGQSYVIQGPPGTGKSQTITNLIADFVAREKAVLFVCEKRAALDVVYHRLKQVGLGDVCSLIHDSQEDKKSFIKELKQIYEAWIQSAEDHSYAKAREEQLSEQKTALKKLAKFSKSMTQPIADTTFTIRSLLEDSIEMNIDLPVDERWTNLPLLTTVKQHKSLLEKIENCLVEAGEDPCLAHSGLGLLAGVVANRDDNLDYIEQMLPRVRSGLENLETIEQLAVSFIDKASFTLFELKTIVNIAKNLKPLAQAKQLILLDPNNADAIQLNEQFTTLDTLAEHRDIQATMAQGWTSEPEQLALDIALEGAKRWEGKLGGFLFSAWRQAKKLYHEYYSGDIKLITAALETLKSSIAARDKYEATYQSVVTKYQIDNLNQIRSELEKIWHDSSDFSLIHRDFIDACLRNAHGSDTVVKLANSQTQMERVETELATLLVSFETESRGNLLASLQQLEDHIDLVPEIGELLNELDSADQVLSTTIRQLAISSDQLEAAVLARDIEKNLRKQGIYRFNLTKLAEAVDILSNSQTALYHLNVQTAIQTCKALFLKDVARANLPLTNTKQSEKDWRRGYNRGRKLLENEFQKSRAYKSIRELFTSEAGIALRKLKPVWLMSPLSVADILPMNEDLFDVVIFDEASQIPLEDAIPSLYRAKQFIVVGDEMQLPPSSFFAAAKKSEAEENEDNLVIYDLNAASFLDRAVGALPNTLLAWHYRSRHESLIGFCNQAFYEGQLKTIPSITSLQPAKPIVVNIEEKPAVEGYVDELLHRPISFHKIENSPYFSQRNTGEAYYIAQIIRELLSRKTTLTFGIVAFSQAQKTEIENELEKLATEDSAFRTALDMEEEREEEGQFTGLFIKNLENVQGDERDVMILSICYGPNHQGKMAMNFGPINQTGGEKRLNVIFSRAKKHMVVVSSIESGQITNHWNYGANALRNYLRYAKAVSEGDQQAMEAAMLEYGSRDNTAQLSTTGQSVADQLAEMLTNEGLIAIRNYGQSGLRCHIAVRLSDSPHYQLAIMIDDNMHYAIEDLQERYVTSNQILGFFGWTVMIILAKDWWQDKDTVIKQVKQKLLNI